MTKHAWLKGHSEMRGRGLARLESCLCHTWSIWPFRRRASRGRAGERHVRRPRASGQSECRTPRRESRNRTAQRFVRDLAHCGRTLDARVGEPADRSRPHRPYQASGAKRQFRCAEDAQEAALALDCCSATSPVRQGGLSVAPAFIAGNKQGTWCQNSNLARRHASGPELCEGSHVSVPKNLTTAENRRH